MTKFYKAYKVLEVNPNPSYMFDSTEPYDIFMLNDCFHLEYETKEEAEKAIAGYYDIVNLSKSRVFSVVTIYKCGW